MTSDDPWWSNYLNDVRDTKHIPERSNGYKRFGYTQTTSVHSTRISDKKKAVTRYARRGGGTAEKVCHAVGNGGDVADEFCEFVSRRRELV